MDCEGDLGFVEKRELKKFLPKHKSISFILLESSRRSSEPDEHVSCTAR
jgi:hypothetical protein